MLHHLLVGVDRAGGLPRLVEDLQPMLPGLRKEDLKEEGQGATVKPLPPPPLGRQGSTRSRHTRHSLGVDV